VAQIYTSTSGLSAQEIETQRAFYQSNPPRCLAGFEARPAELSAYRFDGHGEVLNSYWAVACPCGGDKFSIHGYSYISGAKDCDEYTVFLSPIQLECAACGRAALLFDGSIHGYDPEIDAACAPLYDPADNGAVKALYRCEDGLCLNDSFAVFARFEYPGDLFDESFAAFKGREKDLFTWFTLVAGCGHCGRRSTAADFECA
jgi:hypothetical protein